jgi:3-oxoacyl-[acyl-carrier protein] reductase
VELQGLKGVVTGGSRGIGLGIARSLIEGGATVVIGARGRGAVAAADRLNEGRETPAALPLQADLGAEGELERFAAGCESLIGAPDFLVNNAGGEPMGNMDSFDEARWREAFEVKVWGYVKLSKWAMDRMRQSGKPGSIVNITGSGGSLPQAWYPSGAIVNAGLMAFTRSIAGHASAFGIRVNSVSPHCIRTERVSAAFDAPVIPGVPSISDLTSGIGFQRLGELHEVGAVVRFLVGPHAGFVSGAIIPVDGATLGHMDGHRGRSTR